MNRILNYFYKALIIFCLVISFSFKGNTQDLDTLLQQLQTLQQDIKTLEKAVYSQDFNGNSNSEDLPDNSGVPEGARVIGIPFSRHAIRVFREDIYKNSISSAVIGRLIGLSDEAMHQSFEKRFSRRGVQALKYNLDALKLGHELSDEAGLSVNNGLYEIVGADSHPQMLITGNEAVAFGFETASFFSGHSKKLAAQEE